MNETGGGFFRDGEPATTTDLFGPTGSLWTAGDGVKGFAATQVRRTDK
jgi:hypothetical protein